MLQMHPHYNPFRTICDHLHKGIDLVIKEDGRGQIALSHPNQPRLKTSILTKLPSFRDA
jgi:hypothetical protein